MATNRGPIRREELLSGSFDHTRRARRTAAAIESRVLFTRNETRRALAAFLLGEATDYRRGFDDYLSGLRERATGRETFRAADLERFVDQWESLLPSEPELRASIAKQIATRVPLAPGTTPRALAALAADDGRKVAELVAAAPQPAGADPGPPTLSVVDEVEPVTTWRRLAGGEELFAAGSEPDAVYFVISGHLRAEGDGVGGSGAATEFRRGDVCGETAMLTGEPRMAAVFAVRDSELLCIPQATLLDAARRHPDVLLRLTRAMAAQLRVGTASSGARTAHGRAIALMPAHEGAPVADVAARLATALSTMGATLHVAQQDVVRRIGEAAIAGAGAEESELIAWLSEQETEQEFILYECHETGSPWARRAARQSDRVVMVAEASRLPLAALPQIPGLARDPVVDLLLVQPDNRRYPEGTERWPQPGAPGMTLHWRAGDEAQVRSVARRLGGRGIGVVMSGGGARGYAHIGAIRALEEAGIEIDVWGGTSMGALMAGGFSLGRSAGTMQTNARRSASRRHLLDFTPPLAAVARGKRVTDLMHRETEDLRIEDLWRGYFAVATNLSRSELALIDSGSLWFAIRASIALPGLYPPVPSPGGDLLVDGALMNNLPIDVMRARDDIATVIAINVSPVRESTTRWEYGPYVSGWRLLARALRLPVRGRVPGIVSTLMRATLARSSSAARNPEFLANADLIIEPSVARFAILDFSACDRLVAAGYEGAREALAASPLDFRFEQRG